MEWVDWVIVLVIVLAVLGGLREGFFRSACSLAGLLLCLARGVADALCAHRGGSGCNWIPGDCACGDGVGRNCRPDSGQDRAWYGSGLPGPAARGSLWVLAGRAAGDRSEE